MIKLSKKTKKVAILVNKKSEDYLRLLLLFLNNHNIAVRIVTSKFELDLILLTKRLDHLLISDQLVHNRPEKIRHWVKFKHSLASTIFNERKVKEELLQDDFDMHESESFVWIKNNIIKPKPHKIAVVPETHEPDLFSSYFNSELNLHDEKIDEEMLNFSMYEYRDSQREGYLLLESKEEIDKKSMLAEIEEYIINEFDIDPDIIDLFADKFIGSNKDGHSTNYYGFSSSLPEFNIVENNGKLEASPEVCSDKVKNKFNMYIKLSSKENDYLYVIGGKHLTEKKLKTLKSKQMNIRVEKKDEDKLKTYLHVAHVVNNLKGKGRIK